MAKRKRFRKTTVFGVIEGVKIEKNLLSFLKEVYFDESIVSFKVSPIHGGNPDHLIEMARKNLHCGFDRLFVWIDEDVDLSLEAKQILIERWKCTNIEEFYSCPLKDLQKKFNINMKNPILIVSQPVCVEGLIIRMLGHTPNCLRYEPEKRSEQINKLKSSVSGIIGKRDHFEFYMENLTKELLEEKRRQIPELDLLILMIEK